MLLGSTIINFVLSKTNQSPAMFKKFFPFALAVSLFSMPAYAAMPLVTDDTGTQGKGHVQIELGIEREQETEAVEGISTKETVWSPSATFTYGLAENIDLVAGIPWASQKIEADRTTISDENGIGDISLQIKWRFLELQDGKLSFALKPGITIPTGNEYKGFGNGRVSEGIMLIATRSAEPGAIHINLGYTHNEYHLDSDELGSKKDIWHASLAGELKLGEKFRAVADIGVDTNQEKENNINPVYILGGLIYSPSEQIDFDFGVKGGLNDAEPSTSLLAGVTIRY